MSTTGSVKKNYVYYLINQIVALLLPLVTTPYVSRVLGANGVGEISYSQAIIDYIVIFATLGTSTYASKKIASFQGDIYQQSKNFYEIILARVVTFSVGLIIYMLIYSKIDNKVLFLVQSIYILAEVFNVSWYYHGNENFDKAVIRNVLVKVCGVIFIFLFVKDSTDLLKYVFILSTSNLLGNFLLLFQIRKKLVKALIELKNIPNHILGGMRMFAPQIAGSIYMYFDKIMIGLLANSSAENGYYEQGQKVIRLVSTIVTALPSVMLPRTANANAKNDKVLVVHYLEKSIIFSFFLGMPIAFGVFSISDNLVPWFMGQEYSKDIFLLKVLSPIIIFNGLYSMIGYQYMLGTNQERLMTKTILFGSGINIVLNALLIPKYFAVGAALGSVCAEFFIAFTQVICIRKIVNLKQMLKKIKKYFFSSIIMAITIIFFANRIQSGIIQTFILISIGMIEYLLLLYILRDEFFMEILGLILIKISTIVNLKKR